MIEKIQELIEKNKIKEDTHISLDEFVEAKIWEHGMLKEVKTFRGNTVTSTGKAELAELVGGLDSKTIDTIWCKVDGSMTSRTSSNSRNHNTLSVTHSSSRLGKIDDEYDYPISSIALFLIGVQVDYRYADVSISANTLTIENSVHWVGPNTFDGIAILTSDTSVARFFDKYTGFTIGIDTDMEYWSDVQLTFG